MHIKTFSLFLLIICFILLHSVIQSTDAVSIDPHYNATCSESQQSACGEDFVCKNGHCLECTTHNECHSYFKNAYECVPKKYLIEGPDGNIIEADLKTCQKKDLFPNVTVWDLVTIFLCCFGGALAASSGIGGGAIYVGILTLLAGYPSTMASPISTICILGGSISNVFVLMLQKHPAANRPVIDYNTSLLTEPIILAGTIIGVFLNVMLPDWLTLILLMILLAITSYRSIKKGIETFRKETKSRKNKSNNNNSSQMKLIKSDDNFDHIEETDVNPTINSNSLEEQIISENSDEDDINTFKLDIDESKPEENKELKRMLWLESWRISPFKILILCFSILIIFLTSILKGSKGFHSIIGIQSCREPMYWGIVSVAFILLIFISLVTGIYLRVNYSRKLRMGYKFNDGDIKWNTLRSFFLPIIFLSAGIVAALLGLGGGIIVGPLFLELGMHPRVSTSTSSFLILLTAIATMVQFFFMQAIRPYFAIAYFIAGFVSGGTGQIIIGYIVKKTDRASIIIFIIAFTVGIAAFLQGIVGVMNIYSEIKSGILSFSNLGFKPPC